MKTPLSRPQRESWDKVKQPTKFCEKENPRSLLLDSRDLDFVTIAQIDGVNLIRELHEQCLRNLLFQTNHEDRLEIFVLSWSSFIASIFAVGSVIQLN
jgi:hypothetical protein